MTAPRSCRRELAAALLALGTLTACGRDQAPVRGAPPSTVARAPGTPGELRAGGGGSPSPVRNPLEAQPAAQADGRRLYAWFNCAGCHGSAGGGGIGPPLRDPQWIYGSDPASIFQSIAQGRPNGMPAYGGRIPDEQIWRIELYVRSLGGVDTTVRAGGSTGRSPTQAQQGR